MFWQNTFVFWQNTGVVNPTLSPSPSDLVDQLGLGPKNSDDLVSAGGVGLA